MLLQQWRSVTFRIRHAIMMKQKISEIKKQLTLPNAYYLVLKLGLLSPVYINVYKYK